jgi:hypothetical protein
LASRWRMTRRPIWTFAAPDSAAPRTPHLEPDKPVSGSPRTTRKEAFTALFFGLGSAFSIRGPFFRGDDVSSLRKIVEIIGFFAFYTPKTPPGFARFPPGFWVFRLFLPLFFLFFFFKQGGKRWKRGEMAPTTCDKNPPTCHISRCASRGEKAFFEKNRGDAQTGKVQCFQRCWLFFKALKTVPRVFAGKCHPPRAGLKNGSRYDA